MNTTTPPTTAPRDTLATVRGFVLAIWLAGLLGTGAELLLLGHTEGAWQWSPLALILLSLVVLAWHAAARRGVCLRVFQAVMFLFIAGGVAGMVLHFLGKIEFKRETNPSLAGWELWREALKGAMPPILAPAAMIHFGLLGLAYTYRHPALTAKTNPQPNIT